MRGCAAQVISAYFGSAALCTRHGIGSVRYGDDSTASGIGTGFLTDAYGAGFDDGTGHGIVRSRCEDVEL